MSDYLEIGDAIAVRAATRNAAKEQVAAIAGLEYKDVRVRQRWLKPCDCEDCAEIGPGRAHGYDEFWANAVSGEPGAVLWYVESHA